MSQLETWLNRRIKVQSAKQEASDSITEKKILGSKLRAYKEMREQIKRSGTSSKGVYLSEEDLNLIKTLLDPEMGHSAHHLRVELVNLIPELRQLKLVKGGWYTFLDESFTLPPIIKFEGFGQVNSGLNGLGNWLYDFNIYPEERNFRLATREEIDHAIAKKPPLKFMTLKELEVALGHPVKLNILDDE